MKKTVLFLLSFFFVSLAVSAADRYPASYYEGLRQRIETSLEKGEKKRADFWLARYLAVASSIEDGKTAPDISGLIKQRTLMPASFLSNEYDREFIDWFAKSSHQNWAVSEEHVRERSNAYEIRSVTHGDYFLTVTATPEIQAWFVSGESTAPLALAVGSPSIKPLVYSGKLIGQKPTIFFPVLNLEVGKRGLLYVWPPEFHDLDGDGIPEFWLRYNLTAVNGFSQVLAIYKIKDDKQLVIFKKFKEDSEGVARRLEGNKVQVGHGVGSKANIPHMSFDKYHFETWEFSGGEFKKISEENTDHILKNSEWKKYYL